MVLGGASSKVVSMAGLHIIIENVGGQRRVEIRTRRKIASSQFCTLLGFLLPYSKPVVFRLDEIKNRTLQDLGYTSYSFISYLGKSSLSHEL